MRNNRISSNFMGLKRRTFEMDSMISGNVVSSIYLCVVSALADQGFPRRGMPTQ